MFRPSAWRLAAWVLSVGLLGPGAAQAGWPFGHGEHLERGCPPSQYSPFHYWTPGLYRLHAACHGPTVTGSIPDNYPQIPRSFRLDKYPCRGVDPALLYVDYPLPR